MAHSDVLQGTLELLILKTLSRTSLHGYGIAARIQEVSRDALRVEEGSLYPALHRMEQEKWIRSEWRQSERGRRAKFYDLTALGENKLREAEGKWALLTRAVDRVLRYA